MHSAMISPGSVMVLAIDRIDEEERRESAVLHDVAIVHGARVDSSGQVAATFVRCPGSRVQVHVVRAATSVSAEGIAAVASFLVCAEIGEGYDTEVAAAFIHASTPPMLGPDGGPIRLAEVPATGCPFPALTRPAALCYLRLAMSEPDPGEFFEDRLVNDADYRQHLNGMLERCATNVRAA